MKKTIFALLALLLLGSAASLARDIKADEEPCDCQTIKITGKAVWFGHMIIDKEVVVLRGGSLEIRAGTTVEFAIPPLIDSPEFPWMTVIGELKVQGEPQNPVTFTFDKSYPPQNGQDMIAVRKAKGLFVDNAVFKGAHWALHVHETPALIENSTFEGGFGGVRFKCDDLKIRNCSFVANTIGVRAINSAQPEISGNDFLANTAAIFFRDGIVEPIVTRNNFDSAEYDIKLGESQDKGFSAPENYFTAQGEALWQKIFDGADSEGVGKISLDPLAKEPFKRK